MAGYMFSSTVQASAAVRYRADTMTAAYCKQIVLANLTDYNLTSKMIILKTYW